MVQIDKVEIANLARGWGEAQRRVEVETGYSDGEVGAAWYVLEIVSGFIW